MGKGATMGAFSVIFGSMVIVALVYVILHNSSGFSTVLKGAGSSYAKTAHTFEGG
jgi:hypothetical protein